MPQYRVKDNPKVSEGNEDGLPAVGHVFEWDGSTVDYDGDIEIRDARPDGYGLSHSAWVRPESVEIVAPAPAPKAEVIEETRTIVEKVVVLRLTEDEARFVLEALDSIDADPHFGESVVCALQEAGIDWADNERLSGNLFLI